MKRTPLRRVSRNRAAENRTRAASEQALGRRDLSGTCARCHAYGYVNGHERRARSQGGDPAHPDCLLCIRCNSWCENDPIPAAWDRWKFSRKNPPDPSLAEHEARDIHGGIVRFDRQEGAA